MTTRHTASHRRHGSSPEWAEGCGRASGSGSASLALPVGIGWFYARVLLDTTIRPMFPERVLAADADAVTLAPGALALQPGTWGLRWPAGIALVGPVRAADRAGVVRPLLAGPPPPVGARAMLDAAAFDPDPAARGLAFTEVDVATPLGPCPAWFVPGAVDPATPGRCSSTAGAARVARRCGCCPRCTRSACPRLVVSYRNDPEAPASPDGHYHLGDTEWLDVEAAMAHAIAAGARQFVLVGLVDGRGHHRGAAVALGAGVAGGGARVGRAAGGLAGHAAPAGPHPEPAVRADRADHPVRRPAHRHRLRPVRPARPPAAVRPPTLLIHTAGDTAVPVQPSRALAAAAPALGWPMTYLEVPDAEHTAAWNADPAAYEDAVTRFLARWVT